MPVLPLPDWRMGMSCTIEDAAYLERARPFGPRLATLTDYPHHPARLRGAIRVNISVRPNQAIPA